MNLNGECCSLMLDKIEIFHISHINGYPNPITIEYDKDFVYIKDRFYNKEYKGFIDHQTESSYFAGSWGLVDTLFGGWIDAYFKIKYKPAIKEIL